LNKFSISEIGKETEANPLFPQKTNVQIAEVIDDSTIKVKVWERGSGITMASGSSACAVAFSAKRLNLTRDEVQIILDGGSVNVKCREDGVWISGNIEYVFSGKISSLLFDKSE
jgi:diaminopimelate epimerase